MNNAIKIITKKLRRTRIAVCSMGVFLLAVSCQLKEKEVLREDICGLASPLVFYSDTLMLQLQDYFVDPLLIDTVVFPVQVTSVHDAGKKLYRLIRRPGLPLLSVIDFQTIKGRHYSILLKNVKKEKVTVVFDPGEKGYKTVKVRGSLNFWNANLSGMVMKDGMWQEQFELAPGEYQYLLVADGREMTDPSNPDSIDNNIGGFNSLLRAGKYMQNDLPFLRTVKYGKKGIRLESNKPLSGVFAFWQNIPLETEIRDQSVFVKMPLQSNQESRSFIRVYAYNNDGFSNDVLIPLENGKVLTDPKHISRFDRPSMILYFLMVDRFRNGNTGNDERVDDPEILPKANYFGGDIQGIINALDEGYFDSLGVNTLWLSPITQNPTLAYGLYKEPRTRFSGYHGYWPVSSINIDYRFGTAKEFRDLVNDIHKKNKNIILDYVANHVHELHPVYRQHPEWATNLYLPDGTLNTEKWDEYRLTTWFDTFLPTLDLSRPEVVEPMTDSAVFWVREYGIDGFRHDATKHVDELYWRTLTRKLKEVTACNPMVYQIGETYGSPELINSYISTGMLDGQFDFNVYDDAVAVFARDGESFERLKNSLTQSLRYYGYHNLMGYITGNQDRPRFISLAGGSLKFNEDSKYAGWNRQIGVGDPQGYEKLKMLHAFNLTIPGVPVIYYGDEIGLPGGNDPDNRRWMKFEDLSENEKKVQTMVRKLTGIRSSSMALLFGDLQILYCNETTFAFIRSYFDEFALVLFNKSKVPEKISVRHELFPEKKDCKPHFGSSYRHTADVLEVIVAPLSFEVITNQ
jgi:cyclomaltodextrinase